MNPRLVGFYGPLKDSTFVLPAGQVPAGRDSSNLLCISDISVSRRHCVFSRTDDAVTVSDLGSRNGTLVNGVAVQESKLKHGDQVTIGDSVFLFLLHEEAYRQVLSPVEFDDDDLTRATAQVRPQDVLYLHPDKVLREMPVNSRMARNLSALLQISRVVHSIRDLEELQQQILSLIFEVSPAERGAIMLDRKDGENFTSIFARNRLSRSNHPVRISRTIALQVLKQGIAILGGDVPNSGDLSSVKSLVASQIRSLLCVPMIIFERVTGCIYLDSTDPLHPFDEDHLQLITAHSQHISGGAGKRSPLAMAGIGESTAHNRNKLRTQHAGRKPKDETGLPVLEPRGTHGVHGAYRRGERNRQRTRGARNPPQ